MDLGFVPIYYLEEIAEFKANGVWLGTLWEPSASIPSSRGGPGKEKGHRMNTNDVAVSLIQFVWTRYQEWEAELCPFYG